MNAPSLILASRSPRRRDLLSVFGLPFRIVDANADETPLDNEDPKDMTMRLSKLKSETVAARHPENWVLGGDTTVSVDGEALGKPADATEAMQMLERLSGRSHDVFSAITLTGPSFSEVMVSHTEVDFTELSPDTITAYCNTKEPYDKAGGYGIQGVAGYFVQEIRGSHSGVVGLPLYETRVLLQQAGLIQPGIMFSV